MSACTTMETSCVLSARLVAVTMISSISPAPAGAAIAAEADTAAASLVLRQRVTGAPLPRRGPRLLPNINELLLGFPDFPHCALSGQTVRVWLPEARCKLRFVAQTRTPRKSARGCML